MDEWESYDLKNGIDNGARTKSKLNLLLLSYTAVVFCIPIVPDNIWRPMRCEHILCNPQTMIMKRVNFNFSQCHRQELNRPVLWSHFRHHPMRNDIQSLEDEFQQGKGERRTREMIVSLLCCPHFCSISCAESKICLSHCIDGGNADLSSEMCSKRKYSFTLIRPQLLIPFFQHQPRKIRQSQ